jgi:uncharacterized protein YyaL (SSP411 family)
MITNSKTDHPTTRIPNKLVDEKSPYLLQHAYNPVKWYPWCEEAFQKAADENKPVFLSIGYSTCHWCHVMGHESFEDDLVAEVLNEAFVSIKVDKEERPDIDTVYMTICQATTGHGGWPLTILMTPDKKPFYAATYIPKEPQYGMIGLLDLLQQVKLQWQKDPADMIRTGSQLADIMKREFETSSESADVTKDLVNLAVTQFNQSFDHDYGGFGNEPKFPTPHNLMFLLRHSQAEADEKSLFMVENTLKHMYRGGIYDHVGYGFSRYSTDARWLVPHFEKMLYDNAMLAMVYTEAYQVTKDRLYRTVAEQIFEYIRREMTDPEGGFYCAQDADSEGVEGKYYLFTPEEIDNILDKDDSSFFCEYFDITKEGNFEGASIPNLIKSTELKSDNERIVRMCNQIYTYRLGRWTLHRDDKILTSWNALMVTAYATAARVFQISDYITVAKQAMDFIKMRLIDDHDRIYVRYRDDESKYYGHLDDYAFYCMASICMYETTFEIDYLKQATAYADQMIGLFWDNKYGGFFLTAKDSEELLYRPKEIYDGAIPSGNSVAGFVLQRLAHITANPVFIKFANMQLRFLAGQVKDYPAGHSFALIGFMQALYPTKEIVCVASRNASSRANDRDATDLENHMELSEYLAEHFEPNKVVLLKTDENSDTLAEIADYVEDYRTINDKTTYYVCENHHCLAPTNELVHQLNKKTKA